MSGRSPTYPSLFMPELKEENTSQINLGSSQDEKLVNFYFKDSEDVKGNFVEFPESTPVKISDVKKEKLDRRNIDNDELDNGVTIEMEYDTIKKEINNTAEELTYDCPSPVQLETIQIEEVYIKSEENLKEKLSKKKNNEEEGNIYEFQKSKPVKICEDKKEKLDNWNVGNKFYNDVKIEMEFDTIKEESNTEELDYDSPSPFQLETIKEEEVHIKSEEDEMEKLKKKTPGNQVVLHQCPECPYSTNRKGNLKKHSVRHKKRDEIEWYSCQQCPYKTSRKDNLNSHAVTHSNSMLKCPKCSYETLWANSLKKHQIKHMTKYERMGKWNYCLLCAFKTYNKDTLRCHYLRRHSIHPNSPKQIEIFKCTECSYESGWKYNVTNHQLIHDPNSWLQCSDCVYKTPYKNRLKKHQLTHDLSSSFQCSDCDYKTRDKYILKKHKLQHQGENSEGWHMCLECPYKTMYNSNLRRHVISHRSADEIQWFECLQCSFKTRFRHNLRQHQLQHKEAHEIEWFLCYQCAFKTKRKSNLISHMSKHKKQMDKGYLLQENGK